MNGTLVMASRPAEEVDTQAIIDSRVSKQQDYFVTLVIFGIMRKNWLANPLFRMKIAVDGLFSFTSATPSPWFPVFFRRVGHPGSLITDAVSRGSWNCWSIFLTGFKK